MNISRLFKTPRAPSCRASGIPSLMAAALICATAVTAGAAQNRFRVPKPVEGGISPSADITSITVSNQNLILNWNGFGGPYQLQGAQGVGNGSRWLSLGAAGTNKSATISGLTNTTAFFRVRAPAPGYTSAETCAECHPDTHANWSETIHAGAIETLAAIGQQNNAECLKCHTVAYGFETGFKNMTDTPYFAGVQCENCHGPAGAHAMNPQKLELRPVVTYDAQLCGGCHNGFHHPTYDEWTTAAHSKVDPHVSAYFLDPNPTNAVARMNSCGACHSGAVRLAMLNSTKPGKSLVLPSGEEAATTPQTCTVCHDVHKPNLDDTHSLRNPRYSTNFFSYNTAANTSFKDQYNPNVQICGQCHNERGAAPGDTSRPPHHSPQYNMLIGDIGIERGYIGGSQVKSPHTSIQDQCTHCHTHRHDPPNPASDENPVYTGHTFQPTFVGCTDCHSSETEAEGKVASTQAVTKGKIQDVKALLDTWATTKAPEVLRNKYGKLAWEYTSPGQISNPSGDAKIVGPSTAEQADVPLDIKKARMYLYIVEHDGSYGVHNGKYARFLLDTAKTNINTQLNTP